MTAADFILAFPKFDNVDPADITRWIAAAAPYFDVDRWGAFLADGMGNLVAHWLVEEGTRGAPIDNTGSDQGKAGSANAFFKLYMKLSTDDPLMLTIYGRKYVRLRDMIGMGGAVV